MQTCRIPARFSFEADFCPNKTSRYGKCQHKNKRVTQKEEFQGLRRRENRSVLVHEDFRIKRNAGIPLSAFIAQSPKKTAMRGR